MERRRSKRIFVSFDAELIHDYKSYAGIIENLSENGVGVNVETAPAENAIEYSPGTTLQLKFQPVSGETLSLHCKVKWSHRTPPHSLTRSIGMEIIDPHWERSNYFL